MTTESKETGNTEDVTNNIFVDGGPTNEEVYGDNEWGIFLKKGEDKDNERVLMSPNVKISYYDNKSRKYKDVDMSYWDYVEVSRVVERQKVTVNIQRTTKNEKSGFDIDMKDLLLRLFMADRNPFETHNKVYII